MNQEESVQTEIDEALRLPVFRILDDQLMKKPNYRLGVYWGYFYPTSAPPCIECTDREKGILDGLALWHLALHMKNHERSRFEEVFPATGASEAMVQVRRIIAEFWKLDPEIESSEEMISIDRGLEARIPSTQLFSNLPLSDHFFLTEGIVIVPV